MAQDSFHRFQTLTDRTARSCIESALRQGVVRGLLVIEDRTGQTREYGQVGEEGQRTVKLVVKDGGSELSLNARRPNSAQL